MAIGRPIYVGVGECDCKRVDVQLYRVPDTPINDRPVCGHCMAQLGIPLPRSRTASDLEMFEGQPRWLAGTKEPDVHVGKLDLGHGHIFEVVLGQNDMLIGWLHTHPDLRNPDSELCQSFVAVTSLNGAPVHRVVTTDPLTLSPSLLCRTCGSHGEVIDGKWVPQ